MMVGLSLLLESHENDMFRSWTRSKTRQIVIKQTTSAGMKSSSKPSSFSSSGFLAGVDQFLHQCFLCKHKLLENKDIYMYMGEMSFCSEECRLEHMNKESDENGVRQILKEKVGEDESGGRSSHQNVKMKSLFTADCSPPIPRYVGKMGYKSQANGAVGLHVEC